MIRDVEIIGSVSLTGLSVQIETSNLYLGNGSIPLLSVNNWIVMMQRFNGSLDFYRVWLAYRNGFGDIEQGEFWLGNEKVYRLTNSKRLVYRLRVEVGYSFIRLTHRHISKVITSLHSIRIIINKQRIQRHLSHTETLMGDRKLYNQ